MRWVFLEQIETLEPSRRAVGTACFDPSLELFRDHFPEWPVVPGVLLLEALAQLAGKLIGVSVRIERGDWPFPILSMVQGAKFRKFVRPGEQVQLEVVLDALRDESAWVKVKARVDGQLRAQADQVFVFNAVPLEDPDARKRLEATEGAELARLWAGFSHEMWSR